jgi:hypothetical protein
VKNEMRFLNGLSAQQKEYGTAIKHEWEPFRKEKLPFHYL